MKIRVNLTLSTCDDPVILLNYKKTYVLNSDHKYDCLKQRLYLYVFYPYYFVFFTIFLYFLILGVGLAKRSKLLEFFV